MTLLGRIPLDNVSGRIDHMAVDIQGKRLFVAALGNNSVEVIDLLRGEQIARISDIPEPQGIVYLPARNVLLISSGGTGNVLEYDAARYELLATAKFGDDADNLRYDSAGSRIYVGFGDGAVGALNESGQAISSATVTLPGHPEAFAIDASGSQIFVNIPHEKQIAVVDLKTGRIGQTWLLKEGIDPQDNYPMAFLAKDQTLLIGCRKPSRLLVLDSKSGQRLASLPISGDPDDIFFDASRNLIFISCGEGFLEIYRKMDANHFERSDRIPTARGARTSLWVPEWNQLFLAVPARDKRRAEIWIFGR